MADIGVSQAEVGLESSGGAQVVYGVRFNNDWLHKKDRFQLELAGSVSAW